MAVDDGLHDGDLAHAVQPLVDAHGLQGVLQCIHRPAMLPGLLEQQPQALAGLDEFFGMGPLGRFQLGDAFFVTGEGLLLRGSGLFRRPGHGQADAAQEQ